MTVKQFRKACAVSRKYGSAMLDNGYTLIYTGWHWAIRNNAGSTVDVADDPRRLEYLFV